MYQQYRKVSGNICELVEISANFNDVNEMIIKREKENGLELDEILSKFIFKDWQVGDILLIQDYSVVKPIFDKTNKTIREMTREEICQGGDLSILVNGEYFEAGKIIKVEYNQDLGYLKPTWNRDLKQWLEGATDLEKVQAQISEYSELDTPSTLKEMGTELANECMNMLIELRNMAYTLGNPATIEDRDLPIFPKPSEKLKAFKEKFNSIRK